MNKPKLQKNKLVVIFYGYDALMRLRTVGIVDKRTNETWYLRVGDDGFLEFSQKDKIDD